MKALCSDFFKAVLAGIMIGIGAVVFLSCESKLAGAVLFSVGLLCICEFGLNLYTGKIGYAVYKGETPLKKAAFLLTVWLGNFCGALLSGTAFRASGSEAVLEKAAALAQIKLQQSLFSAVLLGIFCGILMFAAVDIFKRNTEKNARHIGILFCVPVFILCGFEHSIADMAYLALCPPAMLFSSKAILFLLAVTLGNSLGGILFPLVLLINKKQTPSK